MIGLDFNGVNAPPPPYQEPDNKAGDLGGRRVEELDLDRDIKTLEYIPGFGSIVSIYRFMFGFFQFMTASFTFIFAPRWSAKIMVNGLNNIGRGSVGMFPIVGQIFLYCNDKFSVCRVFN